MYGFVLLFACKMQILLMQIHAYGFGINIIDNKNLTQNT